MGWQSGSSQTSCYDVCTGCYSGCNVDCQTCDAPDGTGCESIQNFCSISCKDSAQNFSVFDYNGRCVQPGQIIATEELEDETHKYFNRKAWNAAITRIKDIYAYGKKGGRSNILLSNETASHITASNVKSVADYVNSDSRDKIKQNAVIYGSYFQDIADAINSLEYDDDQCNICNTSCDVTCNDGACQSCDTGGCQSNCNAQSCGDCCYTAGSCCGCYTDEAATPSK